MVPSIHNLEAKMVEISYKTLARFINMKELMWVSCA